MKKIIALAVAAVTLVSSTFALDFSLGGRAILGTNIAAESSIEETVTGLSLDSAFDFGGGIYANFALLGGLGVQAEANIINSTVSYKNGGVESTKSQTLQLDVPLMVWLNLDLWKFTLGFGAGPNFGTTLKALDEVTTLSKDSFKMGLAAGVDLKFYITNHIGLVASGRYIMDFKKDERSIDVAGTDVGSYPTIEYTRRSLYATLGLELKLF